MATRTAFEYAAVMCIISIITSPVSCVYAQVPIAKDFHLTAFQKCHVRVKSRMVKCILYTASRPLVLEMLKIFYRPNPDGIQILHVCHSSRDIESLFRAQ